MMTTEVIRCILCGKIAPMASVKNSISFYINWIEYLPGQWLCRDCKETKHDKNLVRYKLQFLVGDSLIRK
jgi:hypothetical protein